MYGIYFKTIELPVTFKDASLPSDKIEDMAKKLVSDREYIETFVKIRENDALEIYKLAL